MEIRRYKLGEEEAIWQIVFCATRVSNAVDYHPDLIARWAPDDKDMGEWSKRLAEKNSLVAVDDDEIVGLAEIETSDGFIDYFYVHPDAQGCGVGIALMKRVEAEANAAGVGRIHARVSVTARRFFENRGFRVTEALKNVILGHPAPNFVMEKELAAP